MEQQQMAHCEIWSKAMTACMDSVYVAALLGVGDAIVIKPLLKIWSSHYNKIYWPAVPNNFVTVQQLFSDLRNVEVLSRPDEQWEQQWLQQNNVPVLNLRKIIQETAVSYSNSHFCNVAVHWDRQIYEYFDVRFGVRYSEWTAPFDHERSQQLYLKLNPLDEPYVLWHNATSYLESTAIDLASWRQSQNLPSLKIISVTPETNNLLDWYHLIKHAQEIHCVPSSMFCLVDSLHKETGAQLFYHDVRHNSILQVNSNHNSHRWTVIPYTYKI